MKISHTIKKPILCLLSLIILVTSVSSCGSSKLLSSVTLSKEQREFEHYTSELFTQEMKHNTINLHYTLANPKEFGIQSYPVSLGTMSSDSVDAEMVRLENISAALSNFNYDALNTRQQLTYDILKEYCRKELDAASLYDYQEPLRPTTGIHSELPVLLAEYAFYRASDVTDYLVLLTCVEEYFLQIREFETQKAAVGLFMPDYAADTVIAACKKFAKNPKENYLIDTFNTRIDAMEEISDKKKALYKKQNASLVENAVIPAYESLADTLEKLKNTSENSAGLCNFPDGKTYYEYLVYSNTGSDKSVEELQKRTEAQRNKDMLSLHTLLVNNPKLLQSKEPKITKEEPKAILKHLSDAMQKDFFPAANSSYDVNYVHKSLEDTLAPAFYLTAPIDDISHNVIYLNKSSQYSGLQLFTTLAHEGFPGHLYQTTGSYQAGLSPVRALFNYPGYVEGWATYVEMLSYQYAGLEADAADMHMLNQSALLSLYATVDMGIHYDGWELAETTSFLNDYGIRDKNTIQRIYELIVEEPAHYLKYYIGYLEFLELREYAKEIFGKSYSNRAFHQAVIRIGPASFPLLKKYLRDYYTPENGLFQ